MPSTEVFKTFKARLGRGLPVLRVGRVTGRVELYGGKKNTVGIVTYRFADKGLCRIGITVFAVP